MNFFKRNPSIRRIASAIVPSKWRFRQINNHVRTLDAQSKWSAERIDEHQSCVLLNLLDHCRASVPYYQTEDYSALNSLNEYSTAAPVLKKADIRARKESFCSTSVAKNKREPFSTSGTSGTPFSFYWEKGVTQPREDAFHQYWFQQIGFRNCCDKSVILRGTFTGEKSTHRFDPYTNRLALSTYHLSRETIHEYVELVRGFGQCVLQAYPSAATMFCNLANQASIDLSDIFSAVITTSEILLSEQREAIEGALKAPVLDFYGNAERNALIFFCLTCNKYHIDPFYGFTEVLDDDGKALSSHGAIGHVVTTGFNNNVMPMLRYDTGDLVELDGKPNECGRSFRSCAKIKGREQNFFVTGDKRLVSIAALNMHTDIFDNVSQFQFQQNKIGHTDLLLVPDRNFKEYEIDLIQKSIQVKLGLNFKIDVRRVDKIPLSGRGKHEFIKQNLDVGQYR